MNETAIATLENRLKHEKGVFENTEKDRDYLLGSITNVLSRIRESQKEIKELEAAIKKLKEGEQV